MPRVVVVSSPALADGFRLAGVAIEVAHPGAEASRTLSAVVARPDVGVALVTADLWATLDERLQADAERLGRPIVLAIPAGTVADVTTSRQILGEMLERAIGYRIEFGGEADR